MEQEQEISAQSNNQTPAADISSNAQSNEVPRVQEKLIPQSKVDEIIRHSNASVAQKTRDKVLAEVQQQYQPSNNGSYAADSSAMPNINDLVNSRVEKKISELQDNYNKAQREAYFNQVSTDFEGRLNAVKGTYADFDQVAGEFPFASYPNAVLSAMNFENTGHIMYELASNPLKMEAIESFAKKDAENAQRGIKSNLAARELAKISQTMKVNESAKSEKSAKSPLSHIKSSPTSADNGSRSVSDLRAFYRNKV